MSHNQHQHAPDYGFTIDQLIGRIVSLWPRAFTSAATIEAWRDEYQRALGCFQPCHVRQGWDELMRTCSKASYPLPADLYPMVQFCAGDMSPGANMKEYFEKSQIEADRLVDAWMNRDAELLQGLARRHHPPNDLRNLRLIWQLQDLAKKRAWMLGQRRVNNPNHNEQLVITSDEIAKAQENVDSKPASLTDPAKYQILLECTFKTLSTAH